MNQRTCLCIDAKSFFAAVECIERGLDPMTTNLVVADPERSEKTICLAVSPSMKALGVRNRCRVFEIPKNIEYIMAPPRMQKYIDYAAEIYGVYLRYLSKEDIYVYSIDEVFLDVTHYLPYYKLSAREMAQRLMEEVQRDIGVRTTCGIGTNLYLAKIALDITAKHSPEFIGELDEESYKNQLWDHKPITDFWRIGPGTANRLARYGITTMRQVAQVDEDFLYRLFGVDAELLIDHAYGREPVTIQDIKRYKPKSNCLSSGQVLMRDYTFDEAELIVKEMLDLMCLDLVGKGMVTGSVTIQVGYSNPAKMAPAKGTAKLELETSADRVIIPAVVSLYRRIVERNVPIRRINITFNKIVPEPPKAEVQLSLFDMEDSIADSEKLEKNKKIQETMLKIKQRYGKNAILKGMNYQEAATTRERNRQIGGHKSGEQT